MARGVQFTPSERRQLLLGQADRALWRKYYRTAHWRTVRDQKLALAGGRCELCRHRKATQVHHKRYDVLFKEDIRRDLDAVCARCHKRISKG